MKGEADAKPRRIIEARILTLVWPDGRRVLMDYLGQRSPCSTPGHLRRLMRLFKVEVQDTGLRRRWDADHAMPLSEPYEPSPKEKKR